MNERNDPARHRASDAALIEVLRVESGSVGGLGIGELARRLGVTATAVRQRLDRLMRTGLVGRTTVSQGRSAAERGTGVRLRGRPSHVYSLTDKGRRTGGDNFRDLALVLWREIRGVREPVVRRGLISRIGTAMAGLYRDEVCGTTPCERLESTAKILQKRRISCEVVRSSDRALPVLTSYACPYPDLAEQDRGICAAERVMLQDLVGAAVRLDDCRLDGAACCRFTVGGEENGVSVEKGVQQPTTATCIKPG